MSNPEGFFGSIFGSTEDDPLLQSDREAMQSNGNGNGRTDTSGASPADTADNPRSRADRASQSSRSQPPSSPASPNQTASTPRSRNDHRDDHRTGPSGDATHPEGQHHHEARDKQHSDAMEVQEVVLHQHGDETEGLTDLNEAVEDGWRFSHISLDDRIRSASGDVDTQIVVLMERNTPRSLFDFGGAH
jgi:hypothetical protein